MQREGAMFHVLDVGHGNLFFWASPAADILVDASIAVPARGAIPKEPLKYLQRFGASSPINLLILTSPAPDEVNDVGLQLLTRSFQLQEAWVPPLPEGSKAVNEMVATLKKSKWVHGYTLSQLRGDLQRDFVAGDTKIKLLSPHPDDPKNTTTAPLVLRMQHGDFSVLIAPSCDSHRWESMVYHFGDQLRCDALVAPAHGHGKGITAEALDCIRPSLVLVSGGAGAEEVPDRDGLELYQQYVGGHVYLTCQRGNIRAWRTEGQIQLEWDRVAIA